MTKDSAHVEGFRRNLGTEWHSQRERDTGGTERGGFKEDCKGAQPGGTQYQACTFLCGETGGPWTSQEEVQATKVNSVPSRVSILPTLRWHELLILGRKGTQDVELRLANPASSQT